MTPLRKKMLEELQRRNYSESTQRTYLHIVADFAKYFGRSPDLLGLDEVREAHLIDKRKLSANRRSIYRRLALPVRQDSPPTVRAAGIPYPKRPRRLPIILSEDEISRLIESAKTSTIAPC